MSFIDLAADALGPLYDVFGVDAVWTPAGGAGLGVRLRQMSAADVAVDLPQLGRKPLQRRRYRLRVSEAVAVSPSRPPQMGDAVVIGTEALKIAAQPVREDDRRLEWTLELG